MSIITISRGSYSRGKEVAEEAARRLGYECISRDLILEASKEYNLEEIRLVRAIHDAPSILERFGSSKKKFVAYFQAALLKRLASDNKVYHGLAGHYFLQGVTHVLKVRIIADLEDRVRLEMEREGISAKEAKRILTKDDEERRKWGLNLYGIDTNDPSLYDLVIHVKNVTVDDAADVICHTAGLPRFQTTELSQRVLADLALSAEARVKLMNWYPSVEVSAKNSVLDVSVEGLSAKEAEIRGHIIKTCEKIHGVGHIRVKVIHTDA